MHLLTAATGLNSHAVQRHTASLTDWLTACLVLLAEVMAGNDDTRTNRQADNHQAGRQPKEHLHRRHRPNGIYKIRGGDVVDDDDVTYKIRLK